MTDTVTEETTIQETDTAGSTSVTEVTRVYKVTATTVEPCHKVEGLLSLHPYQATPFCSCYAPGPTSTTTVTSKGVTTKSAVHVTRYTATVTPTRSTAFKTVVETTTAITTVVSGTGVTSTVARNATVAVIETVTSTVDVTPVAPPKMSGKLKVLSGTWAGYYAFTIIFDETNNPIEFSDNILGDIYAVDSSGHLNLPQGPYENPAFQFLSGPNHFNKDQVLITNAREVGILQNLNQANQPTCSVLPNGQLACGETAPGDGRVMLSLCQDDSDNVYLHLETQIDSGCEAANLIFV